MLTYKVILTLLAVFATLGTFSILAVTPNEALQKLKEGNKRFVNGKLEHPNRDEVRREALVSKQEPFAIIVGCSDSRVSPEILFDQGVGDLFVVRVAGNVGGPIELDSIEFAAVFLKSSLILVLGHENCGAVNAVLNGQTKDIPAIANLIAPAIKDTKTQSGSLESAIKANVRAVVTQLKNSPPIANQIARNSIKVVGGYFNLESGQVEWQE
jgi:carbonic anhydrase